MKKHCHKCSEDAELYADGSKRPAGAWIQVGVSLYILRENGGLYHDCIGNLSRLARIDIGAT